MAVELLRTEARHSAPRGRWGWPAYLDLILVSFVVLFFEMTCIRWFGGTVIFLTFFTNVVLLACFLGTSVGCLAARDGRDLMRLVIPTALVAVALAVGVLRAYRPAGRGPDAPGLFRVDVGGQESPQQVYFGTEPRGTDPSRFVVPLEVIATAFFALIATAFVGLGQAMGRCLAAIPNRVGAYTANIVGSLLGIAAFAAMAYLRTPPYLWFLISLAACFRFLERRTPAQLLGGSALLLVLAYDAYVEGQHVLTTWSPYYKVEYEPRTREIVTNNIGHQGMGRVEERGPAYVLPHLLNRDAGGRPFGEVLVVGAGSGNDVQAALAHGARRVDAVEIEPVICEIGRADHPDRPYDDPRVAIHLDDARSFIRRSARSYDLVVYALVDSLVLHSGYSSLRLESFLFTEQAFREVKARLRPGGAFVMYNYFRQGWVVGRLARMAERVFGSRPIVIGLPYTGRIAPADRAGFTMLLVGDGAAAAVEAIRGRLEGGRSFWLNKAPRHNEPINGFGVGPPEVAGVPTDRWERIAPAEVDAAGAGRTPTDDWPFLYLREPAIPDLTLRGMALSVLASLAVLLAFAPARGGVPAGRMFFLGAGFMLLECTGVVQMALLFGSTWVVNSIVVAAVLVMILLSNLFVLAVRPRAARPYFALLLASLAVDLLVPPGAFLALPWAARATASCGLTFLPLFFAGVIFAMEFRDSRAPAVALGSNILGAMLGGIAENGSLIVGSHNLLVVAIGFYALAALLRPRPALIPAAGPGVAYG
jgi:SAM-dependent methyltransferase